MNTTLQNNLAAHSTVWVYQSSRKFNDTEAKAIREKIKHFVANWTAHKLGVIGDGDLLFDRFVVLMADESQVGVSGCSIDASVHFIKTLGHEFNVNFFDRWNIAYKKGDEVFGCLRDEFESLVDRGEIAEDTIVFNNLIHNKKDFEAKWQIDYRNSWLKNLRATQTSFNSIL